MLKPLTTNVKRIGLSLVMTDANRRKKARNLYLTNDNLKQSSDSNDGSHVNVLRAICVSYNTRHISLEHEWPRIIVLQDRSLSRFPHNSMLFENFPANC